MTINKCGAILLSPTRLRLYVMVMVTNKNQSEIHEPSITITSEQEYIHTKRRKQWWLWFCFLNLKHTGASKNRQLSAVQNEIWARSYSWVDFKVIRH